MIGSRLGSRSPLYGSVVSAGADDEGTSVIGIIAITGESNAGLRADVTTITIKSGYNSAYSGCRITARQALTVSNPLAWTDYGTGPLTPHFTPTANENMGVELSLGRLLDNVAPGRYAIVQNSIGSASLADHLGAASTYPTLDTSNAFTQTMNYIRQAEIAFNAPLVAMVWIQGGVDALDSTQATNYGTNLAQYVIDVRAVLSARWANVPFVFNKLPAGHVGLYRGLVRSGQVSVASGTANTYLIDTDDLTLQAGNAHFDADSAIRLGERFALKALERLGITQTVALDSTSGKPVPANRLQWQRFITSNALSTGLPLDVIPCDVASGNVFGAHGAISLTASGTLAYRQAVSGWAAVGVGFSDGVTSRLIESLNRMPDVGTTSSFILMRLAVPSNPAAQRSLLTMGSGGAAPEVRLFNGTASARTKAQANTTITGTVDGGFGVRLIGFKLDRTGLLVVAYTNDEKLSPATSVPTGTFFTIGTATIAPPSITLIDTTIWTGAAAEMSDASVKALYQALGVSVPWS